MKVGLRLMMRSLLISPFSFHTSSMMESMFERKGVGRRLTISLEHGGFALEHGSYDSG